LALEVAFRAPEVFGRVGAQSPILLNTSDLGDLVPSADEHPLVIYHGWGRYHLRGPHEGWDMVGTNAELHGLLRQKGYRPAGGETPEGFGWTFWRARTPELLRALFPKSP
jgi:enterochelin esterase-like enzyme